MSKSARVSLHIVVWGTIYLLPYLIEYGGIDSMMFHEPGSMIHAASTALLVAYAYFNHYLLVPKFYLHRRYLLYILLVVVALMMIIWLPQLFRVFEDHPAGPPMRGHGHHGDRSPTLISKLSYNIILFVLATFASISVRQQKKLMEAQRAKLNAELSFLKAQINPHFLFNTLNSIYALSISKSDDTPTAIIQLSELMRYILKDSDADTVPLEKDLNYIQNYVALQKRRLGDTVQISYSAPVEAKGLKIAPLILVSFIENAFKHGVNPDQDSSIRILISIKNNQLHLSVENNKVSSVNKEETTGIGLKNATARLQHLYPGKHQLSIGNGEKTFLVNLILELND